MSGIEVTCLPECLSDRFYPMQLVLNCAYSEISQKVKVKADIALHGNPSQSYVTSLAIWDHTVLPATWHKWTCPT